MTIRELSAVPQQKSSANADPKEDGARTYKGVGKMFICLPRSEVDRGHKRQEGELNEEIGNLVKKVS